MLLPEHIVLCCGFNADAYRTQHKTCNILSEPLQIINPKYSKLVIRLYNITVHYQKCRDSGGDLL